MQAAKRRTRWVATSIMDRSRGMGPLDGPGCRFAPRPTGLAREPQLYPRVDGLRQRDVRRFRLRAVAAKRRVGRPTAESWRTSNVVRSVVRARRLRVLTRPSHTRDVAADLTPGRSGRRGHGPADPLPRLDPGRGRLVALPRVRIARRLGRPVPRSERSATRRSSRCTRRSRPIRSRSGSPPGRYTVTVERGKEYHPERREVTVGDEPVELTVRLRRWIDMAERGWYSGDTHTHRTLAELPNVMLAEDLNVAFPLLDWVREAFVPPIARREASFRDPGPDPIRVDATHLIVPRNTEYEIFTVGKARHTLGRVLRAEPQDAARPGRAAGRPGRGPRAHREGALIELDKHNWPWSMALVPIMPVDLFELSNNHVWQTEFALPRLRRGAGRLHGRRARREGLHGAGLDRVRLPELLRPARLRLPPAADGRDRLGRPSRAARLRPGLRPARRGPRRSAPGSAAWTRDGASSRPARCSSSRSTGTTPGTASSRPTRRPASTACAGSADRRDAAGTDRGRDQRRGRPDDQAGQP